MQLQTICRTITQATKIQCNEYFYIGPQFTRIFVRRQYIFCVITHFCIVVFFSDPHFQRRLFRIFALLHFSQVHICNDFFLHCCIFCRSLFSTTPFFCIVTFLMTSFMHCCFAAFFAGPNFQ